MAHQQFSRLLRLVGEKFSCRNITGIRLMNQEFRNVQLARTFGTQSLWASRQETCRQRLLSVRPEFSVIVPSRGKVKKSPKGKPATHKVPDYEIEEAVDLEAYEEQMNKHLAELRDEYIFNLSITTNVESFERLPVQTNNGVFPLNQLATVIQKSPSLIIIDLQKSQQYIVDITEALKKSQTYLNPQQSSPTSLAIQIPKVSRERRESLAKSAKTLYNTRKAKLNKVYDEYCKKAQKNTSKQDLQKTAMEKLLQIKHEIEHKAEEMMKAKQNELLK